MRIFIGPVEIAGIASGLAKGFAELGVSSEVILSIPHPFNYSAAKTRSFLKFWQFIGKFRVRGYSFLLKAPIVLLHRLFGISVLLWAVFRFDHFIFLFGRTITDFRFELHLIRVLGKKIIFINCGSDIRPAYLDGALCRSPVSSQDTRRITALAARTKRRTMFHQRVADFIVAQPSNAHFYQKKIINYFALGVPIGVRKRSDLQVANDGVVTILHSPSDPIVKGSNAISEVVDSLINEGYPIKFVKLHGVSNDKVLEALSECDFVVDQMYADLPIAVFGAEAAAFGKPCVVAGYLSDDINDLFPKEFVPPVVYVHPTKLRDAILKLVVDRSYRASVGAAAESFVYERWNCKAVAERYLRLLTGRANPEWWFDPNEIQYVGGWGIDWRLSGSIISNIISIFGVPALQVSDKPRLERALVDFASEIRLREDR